MWKKSHNPVRVLKRKTKKFQKSIFLKRLLRSRNEKSLFASRKDKIKNKIKIRTFGFFNAFSAVSFSG